jgi:hypothetical protein
MPSSCRYGSITLVKTLSCNEFDYRYMVIRSVAEPELHHFPQNQKLLSYFAKFSFYFAKFRRNSQQTFAKIRAIELKISRNKIIFHEIIEIAQGSKTKNQILVTIYMKVSLT